MTRIRRTPGRPSPKALIPGAVSLAACEVIPGTLTASGRAVLMLACHTTRQTLTLAVIPERAACQITAPAALPRVDAEHAGLTLARLGGARLTVEHAGRRQVLDVPSVRVLRELVEALGACAGPPVLGAAS